MKTKICSRCKLEKPIEEFYFSTRDGHQNVCKECKRATQRDYIARNKEKVAQTKKEWYNRTRDERNAHRRKYCKANPDKMKKYVKNQQAHLREVIITGYGGKCECCGESEPVFLDIDHINNNGKLDRQRFNTCYRTFYRWLRDNGFPRNEYQLLCSNCNQGKRRNGGICPHQQKKVSV